MLVPHVTVIPYGVDLSAEPHEAPVCAVGAGSRVVTVCELTHRKGVDVLLDAMAILWRDLPDATLDIFGSGDAEHELRGRAARIDSSGRRIHFEGWVQNPQTRLATFSLFCLASRSDNYPLAIIDAMLAGLPVVAAGVGGITEAIDESACGRVVAPESPGLLAGAMRHFLTGTTAAAAAGARGQAYARRRFDVGAVAHAFARLYREHSRERTPSGRLKPAPTCEALTSGWLKPAPTCRLTRGLAEAGPYVPTDAGWLKPAPTYN